MARTKDQARAGRAESAQRSAAVNVREVSRVDTKTTKHEYGDEASSSSGSDRARRAETRGRRMEQVTATAANRDDHTGPSAITYTRSNDRLTSTEGTKAAKVEAASDIESAKRAEGIESENYYTALAGDETEGENGDDAAEDSAGGQSEAPSIKSPLKAGFRGTKTDGQRAAKGSGKETTATRRSNGRVLEFGIPEPKTATAGQSLRTEETREDTRGGTEDTRAQSGART